MSSASAVISRLRLYEICQLLVSDITVDDGTGEGG
jgi:hypothetical protein